MVLMELRCPSAERDQQQHKTRECLLADVDEVEECVENNLSGVLELAQGL